jgi:hypothetical protein
MAILSIVVAIFGCIFIAEKIIPILIGPTTYLNRGKSVAERRQTRQLLPKKLVPSWLPLYAVIPDGAKISDVERQNVHISRFFACMMANDYSYHSPTDHLIVKSPAYRR